MINALLYDEVLHYILEDSNMFKRSLGAISEAVFSQAPFEPYYLTYETATRFFYEFNRIPTKPELLTLVRQRIEGEKMFSNQFKGVDLKLFFDKVYESIYTPDYIERIFFRNFERGEILRILEKYTDGLESKNIMDFHADVDKTRLVMLNMTGQQTVANYAEDIAAMTHIYHAKNSVEQLYSIVPTGYDIIDGYLNGGLHKKQLGVVLAPPNKGKTAIMLDMAYNAAAMGYRVLFLEGEMTREELYDRLNCYASGFKHMELCHKESSDFLEFTLPLRRTGGALYIEEFEMEGFTINQFEERIKRYIDLHKIDVVFIDYIDIMEKSNEETDQLRLQLKKLYTYAKKFAREHNIAIWSASQTNRGGVNNPLITEYNIGEDFSKVAIADKIISLNSTIEEYNKNKARIFIIKNRGGAKYKMVELDTDFELMRLVETIEINYEDFMSEFDITDRGTMVKKKVKKTAQQPPTASENPEPQSNEDIHNDMMRAMRELYGNHNS